MSGSTLLETMRMTLHTFTQGDLDDLYALRSDAETMRYYPKTYSRQESQELLNELIRDQETLSFSRWACRLKETGAFVGLSGLKLQRAIDGHDEIEVGYIFHRGYWNQGLATEAAKGVMQYARTLGIGRLISLIRPENLPSRRVAEKNGLVPEKEVVHKGYVHIVYVTPTF